MGYNIILYYLFYCSDDHMWCLSGWLLCSFAMLSLFVGEEGQAILLREMERETRKRWWQWDLTSLAGPQSWRLCSCRTSFVFFKFHIYMNVVYTWCFEICIICFIFSALFFVFDSLKCFRLPLFFTCPSVKNQPFLQ